MHASETEAAPELFRAAPESCDGIKMRKRKKKARTTRCLEFLAVTVALLTVFDEIYLDAGMFKYITRLVNRSDPIPLTNRVTVLFAAEDNKY